MYEFWNLPTTTVLPLHRFIHFHVLHTYIHTIVGLFVNITGHRSFELSCLNKKKRKFCSFDFSMLFAFLHCT